MIIEQIDNSKVLIVLGGNDMKDFSLEYNKLSFDDPHSGKILKRLLTLACAKTGISVKDKKLLVEAVPQNSGCIILLTLLSQQHRKVYKVKRKETSLCFIFENAEQLICASKSLSTATNQPKNDVYLYKEKYAVIMDNVIRKTTYHSKLTEFAQHILIGNINSARIRENGKLLASYNGIQKIGNFFAT